MSKTSLISIVLFASFALLVTACGGTENAVNSNSTGAGNTNAAPTTSSPATPVGTASSTSTTSGDKIGIPECDDYLAKYEDCVLRKVPDVARATHTKNFDHMRKTWKEMAADAKSKAGLARTCQIAADLGKQQFKMLGCDF